MTFDSRRALEAFLIRPDSEVFVLGSIDEGEVFFESGDEADCGNGNIWAEIEGDENGRLAFSNADCVGDSDHDILPEDIFYLKIDAENGEGRLPTVGECSDVSGGSNGLKFWREDEAKDRESAEFEFRNKREPPRLCFGRVSDEMFQKIIDGEDDEYIDVDEIVPAPSIPKTSRKNSKVDWTVARLPPIFINEPEPVGGVISFGSNKLKVIYVGKEESQRMEEDCGMQAGPEILDVIRDLETAFDVRKESSSKTGKTDEQVTGDLCPESSSALGVLAEDVEAIVRDLHSAFQVDESVPATPKKDETEVNFNKHAKADRISPAWKPGCCKNGVTLSLEPIFEWPEAEMADVVLEVGQEDCVEGVEAGKKLLEPYWKNNGDLVELGISMEKDACGLKIEHAKNGAKTAMTNDYVRLCHNEMVGGGKVEGFVEWEHDLELPFATLDLDNLNEIGEAERKLPGLWIEPCDKLWGMDFPIHFSMQPNNQSIMQTPINTGIVLGTFHPSLSMQAMLSPVNYILGSDIQRFTSDNELDNGMDLNGGVEDKAADVAATVLSQILPVSSAEVRQALQPLPVDNLANKQNVFGGLSRGLTWC